MNIAARIFSTLILFSMPFVHTRLHEPAHAVSPASPHPAIGDASASAHADHPLDCPVCAFRISESLVASGMICLETRTACFADHQPEQLPAAPERGFTLANPRAPPFASSLSA